MARPELCNHFCSYWYWVGSFSELRFIFLTLSLLLGPDFIVLRLKMPIRRIRRMLRVFLTRCLLHKFQEWKAHCVARKRLRRSALPDELNKKITHLISLTRHSFKNQIKLENLRPFMEKSVVWSLCVCVHACGFSEKKKPQIDI